VAAAKAPEELTSAARGARAIKAMEAAWVEAMKQQRLGQRGFNAKGLRKQEHSEQGLRDRNTWKFLRE
jgi:hypothetical protein